MLLSQLRFLNLGLRGFTQSASQVPGAAVSRDWYQQAHITARSNSHPTSTVGALAGSASHGHSSLRGPSAPAAAAVTAPPATPPPATTPILANGQAAVQPEAIAEYVKYGELCQLTYDSFRNKKQAADLLSTPRPGESGFEEIIKEASMDQLIGLLQPSSAARSYQVVDFLYANSGWDFKDDKERGVFGFVAKLLQESSGVKEKLDKLENFIQEQHNWIGFMAVGPPDAEGLQDVAIVFRGTITSTEWANNFDAFLVPAFPWTKRAETPHGKAEHNKEAGWPAKPPRVARGFKRTYASPSEEDPNNRTSPQWQVHETLIALQKDPKYNIGTITTTGHSLGGALATLAAYDLAQDSCRGKAKVRSITFAGPKVGDDDFVASFEKLDVDLTRVVNVNDIVPQVPGVTDEVIKQLLGALPAAAVKANPGDEDFRERVINAAKKAGVGVAALLEYMAKWELNPFAGPLLGNFEHIGPAVNLDSTKLPLIKQEADSGFKTASGCWHNLEGYLYMLDPNREACLINKGCDCLKPNSVHGKSVTANWWGDGPGTDVPPKCPLDH